MLSRNKSNSHRGEDGGEEEATETTVSTGGRCVGLHPSEGLRVLIHHKEQATNVVIKAKMTTTCKLVSQACRLPKGLPELDFLKRCFLCRRELSPCEDVYIYRGEQGFCSKECRSRQILVDERREGERATGERSKIPHRRRAISRIHGSDRNGRIPTPA
ncbi:hypothetical protein OPV22_005274 [Ensete ventricosum]|uniref:FLZ-type domain-containing protein n=1 Tax=Ensete ventricosum TaxID=4639 RepID=A0AAV8RQQ9_ENSVE|nr:hypothetical protein OPV22_005274 [Ensete ventricosum]